MMIHIVMLSEINDSDLLGRACFSSKQAKRARLNHIQHDLFLEKEGVRSLSVDRFGFCSCEKLTQLQDKNAESRSKPESKRSFYGWVQLNAQDAGKNGRKVKSTPLEDNPYHADIILPENIEKDDQKEHANELASYAKWTPRFSS